MAALRCLRLSGVRLTVWPRPSVWRLLPLSMTLVTAARVFRVVPRMWLTVQLLPHHLQRSTHPFACHAEHAWQKRMGQRTPPATETAAAVGAGAVVWGARVVGLILLLATLVVADWTRPAKLKLVPRHRPGTVSTTSDHKNTARPHHQCLTLLDVRMPMMLVAALVPRRPATVHMCASRSWI